MLATGADGETIEFILEDGAPKYYIIGESGVGKTSLIKLIYEHEANKQPPVYMNINSRRASHGTTDNIIEYPWTDGKRHFTLVDTMGFGELKHGTVPHREAITRVGKSVLHCADGVAGIIVVGRTGPLGDQLRRNVKCAQELIGDKSIPILLLLLEGEDIPNTDEWVIRERKELEANLDLKGRDTIICGCAKMDPRRHYTAEKRKTMHQVVAWLSQDRQNQQVFKDESSFYAKVSACLGALGFSAIVDTAVYGVAAAFGAGVLGGLLLGCAVYYGGTFIHHKLKCRRINKLLNL